MLAMSKSSSGSGYQSLDSGDVGFDMPVDPSWFERHRKKIEAVPLFVIGSYLTKKDYIVSMRKISYDLRMIF